MRAWYDYARKALFILVPLAFAASVIYMVYYIVSEKALLIPRSEVTVLSEWTYTDELGGTEKITSPARIDTDGRTVFIYEAEMPDNIEHGSVLAFLNRTDITVEIGGRIAKQWSKTEAPLIGGVAKNSYFFIPLGPEDSGAHLKITIDDEGYGGKIFGAFVGNEYEVVRFLEIKSGALQFAMSFALLVCSLAIAITGCILTVIYKQNVSLILMALGIFAASSWMFVDSFVFQFLFRTQFIDGFISYITTLCIPFPFVAYLDAIQGYRYRKWYSVVGLIEFANLLVFSILHLTHTVSFTHTLLYLDIVIGIGTVISLIITLYDIIKGNAANYRFVSYGFLAFLTLAIVEIVLINTVVERVEGGAIIAGLYILFAFAIVQQLTEIRDVTIERDRANEEGAAKTKFLASMSHEIRTPINSILGMNEMILKESSDPNVLNYANIINDSGTMLLSLINDVLDVSKIDNDMEEIVCENYDPEKMFDNAVEMLRTQATKKGLAFKVGKPRNFPKLLYGDEKRITQIVVNLITNAVKYTEEGTVTFTGECFASDSRYVLCFYVSDTGIGIKKEDIDGIFDPFRRLDIKKNQNIQGTGLGLSIVKSLVDKMDGEIKVESTYGKGSTFSVRIPQQMMENSSLGKYNSGNAIEDDDLRDIDPQYIAPEARVLEVDDNVSNQMVVRLFLKETGVKLDVASSGKEAVKLCRLNRYDVILMDHMMPEPDGIETMHQIRSDEAGLNTHTPQIILTANALMGSRSMYEEEGFDNYLSKPVESVRLLKMVRKYLPEDKVMYKPKKRALAPVPNALEDMAQEKDADSAKEGPVDIAALFARFDNKEETVHLILEEVIKEGERKIPLLRELAEQEDVKRYAVEAHGVKGVMASSCASGLSATAKSHELAAKEGNASFIKDNIESFLKEYEEVLDYIRDYLGDGL
ncbi:MAG: response regulator [Lachnospiraceae bacterium]|nr:response regulator [Lachnospiraceae bacterium]